MGSVTIGVTIEVGFSLRGVSLSRGRGRSHVDHRTTRQPPTRVLGDDLVEPDDNVVVFDPIAASLDRPVGKFAWQRIAVVTEKIAQTDEVGERQIGKLRHRRQHDTSSDNPDRSVVCVDLTSDNHRPRP